jgi:acetyl esterase/lipase
LICSYEYRRQFQTSKLAISATGMAMMPILKNSPAFIVVGAIDLFVDEDIECARRLIAAGVPAELHVVPSAYHAYDLLVPKATVTARFTEYWTTALRRALASG